MASPVPTLLATNLRRWFTTRGFLLAFVVAAVPLLLTAAWVWTHQADVTVGALTADKQDPVDGDTLNLTATVQNAGNGDVGAFNTTVYVLSYVGTLQPNGTITIDLSQSRQAGGGENKTLIEGLGRGETATASLEWTARTGIYLAVAVADIDGDLPEIEELNNIGQLGGASDTARPFAVQPRMPDAAAGPVAPFNATGNASANTTADLEILELSWTPQDPSLGDTLEIEARVRNLGPDDVDNATLKIEGGRLAGRTPVAQGTTDRSTPIRAGETTTINLTWQPREAGAYWIAASADVGPGVHDPVAADNHLARPFVMKITIPPRFYDVANQHPSLKPAFEAQEKATIKDFYDNVLTSLQLRLLIPFIALFYAVGVLADDKRDGVLPYLLTRPVPRWSIPLTRFAASFLVSAAAVVLGFLAAFALLFQTPGGDVGYLSTSVLAGLLTLFVYGAFFTLLGVAAERPYLVGAAFVLGWETLAGLLVGWVNNITFGYHVGRAVSGWPLDQGLVWLPQGDAAREFWGLLIAGVALLGASVYVMRKREFDLD